jgi:hypothetical protein
MMALEKEIGAQLILFNFERNKLTIKAKQENFQSNYIRVSNDGQFVHLASVAIYCPQPKSDDEFYLAPMSATIEAGVEYRAVVPELYRPKDIRSEAKLQSHDCTFQPSGEQIQRLVDSLQTTSKFDVPKYQRMVILPRCTDREERIEELINFFQESTSYFFTQFSSQFPFDYFLPIDIEQLALNKTWALSSRFETSPFKIAGAAEAFWRKQGKYELSQQFKILRRNIFKNPIETFVPFDYGT